MRELSVRSEPASAGSRARAGRGGSSDEPEPGREPAAGSGAEPQLRPQKAVLDEVVAVGSACLAPSFEESWAQGV